MQPIAIVLCISSDPLLDLPLSCKSNVVISCHCILDRKFCIGLDLPNSMSYGIVLPSNLFYLCISITYMLLLVCRIYTL